MPAKTRSTPTKAAMRLLLLDGKGINVGARDGIVDRAMVGCIVVGKTDGAKEGCKDGIGVVGVGEGAQDP